MNSYLAASLYLHVIWILNCILIEVLKIKNDSKPNQIAAHICGFCYAVAAGACMGIFLKHWSDQ